jgi:hypothetical protein
MTNLDQVLVFLCKHLFITWKNMMINSIVLNVLLRHVSRTCIDVLWCISDYFTLTIMLKIWQPSIHGKFWNFFAAQVFWYLYMWQHLIWLEAKNCPKIVGLQYITYVSWDIMISWHDAWTNNAWWHHTLSNYISDKLKSELKISTTHHNYCW